MSRTHARTRALPSASPHLLCRDAEVKQGTQTVACLAEHTTEVSLLPPFAHNTTSEQAQKHTVCRRHAQFGCSGAQLHARKERKSDDAGLFFFCPVRFSFAFLKARSFIYTETGCSAARCAGRVGNIKLPFSRDVCPAVRSSGDARTAWPPPSPSRQE